MLTFLLALLVTKPQLECAQNIDAASLRIVPSSLQLFEYKSVSFTCEGFKGQRRVRNQKEFIPMCPRDGNASVVACTVEYAFETDSGQYWCESEDGHRSNTVNITVTAGSVILEGPVLPVMEGDAVTLRCRHKNMPYLPADFYKDGHLVGSGDQGQMTIGNVSKSDEGFYSCSTSESGKSAGSPLTVRHIDKSNHQEEVILEGPVLPVMEGDAVTLRCRLRKTVSNHPAEFYKDGIPARSSLTGDMSILSVSASDEGLYSCAISGFGRSTGSRLMVRRPLTGALSSHRLLLLLWIAIIILVVLLLSVIGQLHYIKQTVSAVDQLKTEARMEPYVLS
ncbi:Fc receptor-like A [Genypterus blacodes]|uniref:Fc receptor-like A n=1 Tax=Genypterus blacodes TaxID=154954 RepID=UPI003F75E131